MRSRWEVQVNPPAESTWWVVHLHISHVNIVRINIIHTNICIYDKQMLPGVNKQYPPLQADMTMLILFLFLSIHIEGSFKINCKYCFPSAASWMNMEPEWKGGLDRLSAEMCKYRYEYWGKLRDPFKIKRWPPQIICRNVQHQHECPLSAHIV